MPSKISPEAEAAEERYRRHDDKKFKQAQAPRGSGLSRQIKVVEESNYYQKKNKSAVKLIDKTKK